MPQWWRTELRSPPALLITSLTTEVHIINSEHH